MDQSDRGKLVRIWRILPWAIAAGVLLLLPLIAMAFTDEVSWDGADFATFGAMLLGACSVYELAARTTSSLTYRAAAGIAVLTALFLVWLNLAVGVIGSEDNPANLMYAGVLGVAVFGAVLARGRPGGLARTFVAAALAQVLVGVIAVTAGFGSSAPSFPEAILFLTGFFALLWLVSASLFWRAAELE